jgi:hypothetical protein
MAHGKGVAHEANIGAKISATAMLRDVLTGDQRALLFGIFLNITDEALSGTDFLWPQTIELRQAIRDNWNGK